MTISLKTMEAVALRHQHHSTPPYACTKRDGLIAMALTSTTPVTSAQAARALDLVRDCDGDAPPEATQVVERALSQTWVKLRANPSYAMSPEEFAVFTWARLRPLQPQDAAIAKRASAVYWDNHRGSNSGGAT